MWKKRVLITQWAGQAWDELCQTFDFAAAARKIGMLMTIDGTNDDVIRIDGVEKVPIHRCRCWRPARE